MLVKRLDVGIEQSFRPRVLALALRRTKPQGLPCASASPASGIWSSGILSLNRSPPATQRHVPRVMPGDGQDIERNSYS